MFDVLSSVGKTGQILRLIETAMQDHKWRRKVDLRKMAWSYFVGATGKDCCSGVQTAVQPSATLDTVQECWKRLHFIDSAEAPKLRPPTRNLSSISTVHLKNPRARHERYVTGAAWPGDWDNCLYFELLRREAKELIDP